MNLSLANGCFNRKPFVNLIHRERWCYIYAMNAANDVGIYCLNPTVFKLQSGCEISIMDDIVSKVDGCVLKFDDGYWFKDGIALCYGMGENLARNKMAPTIIKQIIRQGISPELVEAIMRAYPSLRKLYEQHVNGIETMLPSTIDRKYGKVQSPSVIHDSKSTITTSSVQKVEQPF